MTRRQRSNGPNSNRRPYRTDGYLTVSTRIVLRLADETDTDVDALPTLYESINPEALDRLVESADSRPLSVTFEYYGHHVTVTEAGAIDIQPL